MPPFHAALVPNGGSADFEFQKQYTGCEKCKWVGSENFPPGGPKTFPYGPPVFEF
jgi:hypothetical protein